MKMKKTIALGMALILLACMGVGTYAAVPDPIVPLWDNINSMTNVIVFDGNDGTASAVIIGKPGTTRITGTLTVYKSVDGEWVYVDSAADTGKTSLSLTVDFTGEDDVQYKSVFEVTATRNGIDEDETKTAYRTC